MAEWCSVHWEMVKGGMNHPGEMQGAKPNSYFRKKTDLQTNEIYWKTYIISVKAVEKLF